MNHYYDSTYAFLQDIKNKIDDEILYRKIQTYIKNMEGSINTLHEIVDEYQSENEKLEEKIRVLKIEAYDSKDIRRI